MNHTDNTNKKTVFDIFRETEKEREKAKESNPISSIHDIYNDMNFSEQYGNNIFLVIFLTLIMVLFSYYMQSKANSQPIIDNWAVERCKPQNILMAGFINKPADKTATEYTGENFSYCVNDILKNIVGDFMQPFNYLVIVVVTAFDSITQGLGDMRKEFEVIRSQMEAMFNLIFTALLNFVIPLQQMLMGMKDMIAKTNAIMVTGLFTLLCVFYALIDIVGLILSLAIFILVILTVAYITLGAMLMVPFMYPIILPMFIPVSISFLVMTVLLSLAIALITDVQNKFPVFCFTERTQIEKEDGTYQSICKIQPGDILKNKGMVTAVFQLSAKNVPIYELNGVEVSGGHYVHHKDKWIQVKDHPSSRWLGINGHGPFLYCLNTSNKEIDIQGTLFSDWDDLFHAVPLKKILAFVDSIRHPFSNTQPRGGIHEFADGGFMDDTMFCMVDGTQKQIKEMIPGDCLEGGSQVQGVVIIDGKTVRDQYRFSLGETSFAGGPYLVFEGSNSSIMHTLQPGVIHKIPCEKQEKLYHLITDTGVFLLGDILFHDYNSLMEYHTHYKQK